MDMPSMIVDDVDNGYCSCTVYVYVQYEVWISPMSEAVFELLHPKDKCML